ncbi:MAG TPA: hypothetical protein VJR46_11125 [Candidatus Dormibacteraeota bacterium]|nr:hypothetical protein [Candidatus Dormibacteraeota bacterium]
MRCGTGGTPPGALVDGRIADVGGVAGSLRQLLARVEIRETRALVAVSDALATFRVLRFPQPATDDVVQSAVQRQMPGSSERMASHWTDVHNDGAGRVVYAVAWDRDLVKRAADAARGAGLDPVSVELKSACIARAVNEPSCVVVDMSGNPMEVVVVRDHLPELWHSFEVKTPVGEDLVDEVGGPLRQVLRYYAGRRDAALNPSARILIAGDQVLSGRALLTLSHMLGHPVEPLPLPPRVPEDLRHGTFLTCLGLLMRREP